MFTTNVENILLLIVLRKEPAQTALQLRLAVTKFL